MTEPSHTISDRGRVALVSGASRGIGAAIAARLAAEGWRLSLGMRQPKAPKGVGDDAQIVPYDATGAAEGAWVEAALARFGRIDAVVCNAGLMAPKSVIDVDDETLDAMWEVNVKAPRRLIQAAWPSLTSIGRGRVVIIASLSGKRVKSAASGAYAMTKHAAVALSHGVRQAGWEAGVRSTAVCPGFVATDMARAITNFPEEKMTRPKDVARLVSLALDTPNEASVSELHVNATLEEFY